MRFRAVMLLPVIALVTLFGGATQAASAATWVVDDDGVQCGNADFASIQAAVNAASPGDVIHVCAGVYRESVTVAKEGLTLKGDPEAIEAIDCFGSAQLDPAQEAIVEPEAGEETGFDLEADGVSAQGLVLQHFKVGIETSDEHSGYDVDHNLIQLTSKDANGYRGFGLDLGSSGALESRVHHNCFRQNGIGGVVSELDNDAESTNRSLENARDLRNARIDHNDTFQNPEALTALGPGSRENVRLDHNRSRADGVGIGIQNSTQSRIAHNQVTFPGRAGLGVFVGGSNVGLTIDYNLLQGGSTGIIFQRQRATLLDKFPAQSQVSVDGNVVTGASASGIAAATGNVVGSTFASNTSDGNAVDGLLLQAENTGNAITANVTDNNHRNGMHAAGATGNTFEGNEMLENGIDPLLGGVDARDGDNPSQTSLVNLWTSNNCQTDFPAGLICFQG